MKIKRFGGLASFTLLLLILLSNSQFPGGKSALSVVHDDEATVQTTLSAHITTFGLVVNAYNQSWNDPNWLNKLKNSGCTWIKMDIYNSQRSVYNDSLSCLELLHNESMKCLGVFGQDLNMWNATTGAPVPIDNLTEWQILVQDALQNYGPFLDAVECWNEPDLTQNQNGYMNGPQHYFEMLQILYNETKAYAQDRNETIDVVAGSVVTIYSILTQPGLDVPGAGTVFIQNIKDLGSDGFCDAYSMHIYMADANPPVNANPEQFLRGHNAEEAYEYIKNITDANATNPKPLWVSEMGTHDNTDEGQASQMQAWFEQLASAQCPMAFWYNYIDPIENVQGILETETLKERPAFCVFESECAMIGDTTGPNGWPDGVVDIRDVALVARHINQSVPPAPPNCDVTGPTLSVPDGKVDIRDVVFVASHYGQHDP